MIFPLRAGIEETISQTPLPQRASRGHVAKISPCLIPRTNLGAEEIKTPTRTAPNHSPPSRTHLANPCFLRALHLHCQLRRTAPSRAPTSCNGEHRRPDSLGGGFGGSGVRIWIRSSRNGDSGGGGGCGQHCPKSFFFFDAGDGRTLLPHLRNSFGLSGA